MKVALIGQEAIDALSLILFSLCRCLVYCVMLCVQESASLFIYR